MVAVVFVMGVSGSGKTTIGEGLGTVHKPSNKFDLFVNN